jgi:hypothetical protein
MWNSAFLLVIAVLSICKYFYSEREMVALQREASSDFLTGRYYHGSDVGSQ